MCRVSFLDRANIGNAKIAGMADDLNLHGMQYNVAVTTFFISYGLLEVPSNIILKMMRPARWIAILLLAVSKRNSAQLTIRNRVSLSLTSRLVGDSHDAHGSRLDV